MNNAEITLIRYRMDRAKEALSAARLMYGQVVKSALDSC